MTRHARSATDSKRQSHFGWVPRLLPPLLLGLLSLIQFAEARVTRLAIEHRQSFADGKSFGAAGPYEHMTGTAYFEVDPANPHNTVIFNLDHAPRNARGLVEYSAPIIIIEPVNVALGNGKIFYSVNNRGNTDLGFVTDATKVSGRVQQQMAMGFTMVDAGWHGDGIPNARQLFPKIPGVEPPKAMAELDVLDFGPDFSATGGRLTIQPPKHGAHYQLFVPRPDKDGQVIADVRAMEVAAPLGTSVGWNVRDTGHRAGDLCGLEGAYFPFAKTNAERMASGDPRLSLEERYHTHAGFVAAVNAAAGKLVRARLMLPDDVAVWVKAAEQSNVLR